MSVALLIVSIVVLVFAGLGLWGAYYFNQQNQIQAHILRTQHDARWEKAEKELSDRALILQQEFNNKSIQLHKAITAREQQLSQETSILHSRIKDEGARLESIAQVLRLTAIENRKFKQEVDDAYAFNKDILDKQQELKKRYELELYNCKESMLWLVDHYKELKKTSKKLLKNGSYSPEVYQVIETADYNLKQVTNYFMNIFRMHPEDYRLQKKYIKGSNDNGDTYQTSSTLN